jgi:hypothetical protein
MPIRSYLDGYRFDAETTRIMGVAFETARIALRPRIEINLLRQESPRGLSSLQKPGSAIPIFCVSASCSNSVR